MAAPPEPPSLSAWRKCVKYAAYAKEHSPRVTTLLRRISSLGCALPADPILCEDAFRGAPLLGGYDPARGVVVMNPGVPSASLNQAEWTRTIVHELVHAYDHCRAELSPTNCAHLACTEVRAANLSGDCDFGVDVARGGLRGWTVAGHQQKCVRRRAEASLAAHASCVGRAGGVRAVVDDVWDACYADTAPFPTN